MLVIIHTPFLLDNCLYGNEKNIADYKVFWDRCGMAKCTGSEMTS